MRLAVEAHQAHTETDVMVDLHDLPAHAPQDVKVALYRLAQECINNSFRHAGGAQQKVAAGFDGSHIKVQISDEGPGPNWVQPVSKDLKLGLAGLKYRMIALGGSLIVETGGRGYVVSASIPLQKAGLQNG